MTKIAAIGLPTLLGVGLSVAGGLVNMSAQRSHANKQEAANRQWMAYQDAKTKQFEKRDAEEKARSRGELNENLDNSGIDARENVIANEEARLSDVFGGSDANLANITAEAVGAGQGGGQSKVFDKEMARQLGDASAEAKKRIQAMARTTAYGGGSMGGMGVTDMLRNVNSQAIIGGVNDNRRGNVGTLQKYQQVEPQQLVYKAPLAGQLLSAAGGLIGSGAFSGTAGAAANAAKTAADPWAGLRNITNPLGPG